jgi:hypothetical protein
MSNFIKIGLMIIVGIAVLCVILLAIIGCGKKTTTTINPTLQSSSESVATSIPVPTQMQDPTKTPPTQVPKLTQETEKSPAIGKVGDRIESTGEAISLIKVDRQNELGKFRKADKGKTYVVVEVLIENVGRDDPIPYNPLYFKLKDEDGFEYNPNILGPDKSLMSGELPKGDKVRGVVAFEIPNGAKGLIMQYKPLVFSSNNATIIFQLDE